MEKLYQKAGVNLIEAQKLNDKLSKNLGIKSFAGIADLSEDFSLAICCDGIGSKIIPLYERKLFKTIAADVVAANLNDLICTGGKALGFVDYIAANKLESNEVFSIVEAIKKELDNCGCKFLGGETSEISELITKGNIDISGFAVGIVKKENRLDKNSVKAGNLVIGLCSSGIHANGFSLIRKLYAQKKLTDKEFETCLVPTCNYYKCVSELAEKKLIKSCANITGGGIFSNLIRIIPDNLSIELDFEKIPPQSIFQKLKLLCGSEFFEVFNAGVGFCLIADEKNLKQIFEISKEFKPFIFGKIIIKNKE